MSVKNNGRTCRTFLKRDQTRRRQYEGFGVSIQNSVRTSRMQPAKLRTCFGLWWFWVCHPRKCWSLHREIEGLVFWKGRGVPPPFQGTSRTRPSISRCKDQPSRGWWTQNHQGPKHLRNFAGCGREVLTEFWIDTPKPSYCRLLVLSRFKKVPYVHPIFLAAIQNCCWVVQKSNDF